jgi:hypothetical protein
VKPLDEPAGVEEAQTSEADGFPKDIVVLEGHLIGEEVGEGGDGHG